MKHQEHQEIPSHICFMQDCQSKAAYICVIHMAVLLDSAFYSIESQILHLEADDQGFQLYS